MNSPQSQPQSQPQPQPQPQPPPLSQPQTQTQTQTQTQAQTQPQQPQQPQPSPAQPAPQSSPTPQPTTPASFPLLPLSATTTAAVRPVLPDRNVTPDTLVDAYVSFIYYCNPALPPDADTGALRLAFRSPPKNTGRSFNTFTIFELVKQFTAGEIKTWTDLIIALGVAPPDVANNESSQKVAQYGVRLKKWLYSLHIRSFFEYLLGVENDYWTKIPSDPDPIATPERDGIRVEDDMALRALLPHIRPKRGRKRPDDSEHDAQGTQRRRLSPASAIEYGPASAGPWSAHPNSHHATHLDIPRSAVPGLGPSDGSETPAGRWPSSAITPTVRGSFWEDSGEPQSAVTPTSRGRLRRGVKAISSAWRPSGPNNTGKVRGRPPINRNPEEGPIISFHNWDPPTKKDGKENPEAIETPSAVKPPQELQFQPPERFSQESRSLSATSTPSRSAPSPAPVETVRSIMNFIPLHCPPQPPPRPPMKAPRPGRPSISLQVPEHASGPIRLATPPAPLPQLQAQSSSAAVPRPPVATATGHERSPDRGQDREGEANATSAHGAEGNKGEPYDFLTNGVVQKKLQPQSSKPPQPGEQNVPLFYFERMSDRRNADALMAYFIRETHDSIWLDANGNPDEPGTLEESTAVVNATIEDMLRKNPSTDLFLLNLAALAGAKALMTTRTKSIRVGSSEDHYIYKFEWEYRFGHFSGTYNMTQYVNKGMFTKPPPTFDKSSPPPPPGREVDNASLTAEEWQRKYEGLLGEVEKREKELMDLKARVQRTVAEERVNKY